MYKTEWFCTLLPMKKAPDCRNKALCYIRVSTEEQAREGVSLQAQEEKLRAYCAAQGLEIAGVIRDEAVSGGKPLAARAGGERLLQEVSKGRVWHVVSLRLDRLFRDAADALVMTRAWDKAGVALHLVDLGGQALNTASAMGRFFLSAMAAIAELERNLIGERTAAALQYKKRQRQVYARTPLGYKRVEDRLVKDQRALAAVRKIKELRSEGATLRKIAEDLNRARVKTALGGKWYASTVKYVLENDLYQ